MENRHLRFKSSLHATPRKLIGFVESARLRKQGTKRLHLFESARAKSAGGHMRTDGASALRVGLTRRESVELRALGVASMSPPSHAWVGA
ncbi:MAG: hypothetical protein IPK13_06540 [Deltaproteobacteria bacterium]|nr:hypothetical protein [Deltaproteobacteria bacterium]